VIPRLLACILAAGLCLTAPTEASANCEKAGKLLTQLGKATRTTRNPLSSGSAVSKAQGKLPRLKDALNAALGSCDWISTLAKHPALAPFRDAAISTKGTPEADAVRNSWVQAEIGVRGLVAEDDLCLVFTRKSGGPHGRACFKGQDRGLSSKNLRRLAKGWCASRKTGQSQQGSIDTNKLAGLFEVSGLPTGMVQSVLDRLAGSSCPETL
jgi:hypothetical protein